MTPYMWGFIRGDFTIIYCPIECTWYGEFTPNGIFLNQVAPYLQRMLGWQHETV